MARKVQPEMGVRSPYQARYRLNIGECSGLDLSHDVSSVEDTALVDAVNVRVHDGIVISRYGQSQVPNSPGDGCIQGMIDIKGVGTKMALADNEVANSGSGNPAAITFLDEGLPSGSNYTTIDELVLEHPAEGNRNGTDYEDDKPRYVYQWWDGNIVFQNVEDTTGNGGEASDQWSLYKILIPEDGDISDVNNIGVEALFPCLVEGEGSPFMVSSMCLGLQQGSSVGQAPLYFGTMAGGVVGYINGQMRRLLADSTITGRVIVFRYNSRIYAAGAQDLWVQNGWTTGNLANSTSWSQVSMPAGPVDFRPMCAIEWNGFGWIGGFDANDSPPTTTNAGHILKLDDSSGTPVLTVAINDYGAAPDFLNSVDDFAIARGNLLYVAWRWNDSVSEFASFGKWDGSSPLAEEGQWLEAEAMIPRMQGTQDALYVSGWGDAESGKIIAWNGSSEVVIHDFVNNDPTPFDMVLF